jgi:hypothetical protein
LGFRIDEQGKNRHLHTLHVIRPRLYDRSSAYTKYSPVSVPSRAATAIHDSATSQSIRRMGGCDVSKLLPSSTRPHNTRTYHTSPKTKLEILLADICGEQEQCFVCLVRWVRDTEIGRNLEPDGSLATGIVNLVIWSSVCGSC